MHSTAQSLARKNLGLRGQRGLPEAKGGGPVAKPQKLIFSQSKTHPRHLGTDTTGVEGHTGPQFSGVSATQAALLSPWLGSGCCPGARLTVTPCPPCPATLPEDNATKLSRPPAASLCSRSAPWLCAVLVQPSWSPAGPFHAQSRVLKGLVFREVSSTSWSQLSAAQHGSGSRESRVPIILNREEVGLWERIAKPWAVGRMGKLQGPGFPFGGYRSHL